MNLRQFQDRLLNPAVGWKRNYHMYYFIDPRSFVNYGPRDTQATDSNAASFVLNEIIGSKKCDSDLNVRLAQLLPTTSDVLYYLYDLGDRFMHKITVDSIPSPEVSSGAVALLDGAGANIPEDSFGMEPEGENGLKRLRPVCNITSSLRS
jgi:hypothetical protein